MFQATGIMIMDGGSVGLELTDNSVIQPGRIGETLYS
jgi:hypothetical protein